MHFYVIDGNSKIKCNIIKAFKDDSNNVSYVIYTDGTKDSNGELEIYASRYTIVDGKYVLEEIGNEYEWNLIDNMLESMGNN